MMGRARSVILPAGAYQADESGKIFGAVKDTPTLALTYQGDNLQMKLIGIFYTSEEIAYYLQFIRSRLRA